MIESPTTHSQATCAAAHDSTHCLAVGGHKSSSGSYLVQVAQALPKPPADAPAGQYACRLDPQDVPTSLAWSV